MPTPKKPNAEPERSCIVTRAVKPKEELLRFAISPQGDVVPDIAGKLPGRGIYVSVSRLCVSEAMTKRLFSKAAGQQVQIYDDILERIEQQLRQRMADALSMARKAGQVLTGFEKVEEALHKGEVIALVHASDAADDGKRKLKSSHVPVFTYLTREQLSKQLGRENAVHVALTHGSAAEFFIESARRFALFMD